MKRNAVRRWRSFCGRQKMPPRKGWAAVYCRLSKEDEDKAAAESESIRNQRALLLDWAATHGYHVYNVYTDEDYSGIDRARPGFNAMLNDARQGKFEVILAKTQSRFTRDMELVERYLHGLFPEWGVRFIAVLDHVDTCDPAGKKARQINGLINEWYLEDLSGNVRAVLDHKRHSGCYIASFALYGYRKNPADHNRLVIDPPAAAVVRRIFALYAQGAGRGKDRANIERRSHPPAVRLPRSAKRPTRRKANTVEQGNCAAHPVQQHLCRRHGARARAQAELQIKKRPSGCPATSGSSYRALTRASSADGALRPCKSSWQPAAVPHTEKHNTHWRGLSGAVCAAERWN